MNPIINHQLGQATHREYEAKYGHRYMGDDDSQQKAIGPFHHHKLALALSGGSVTAVIIALIALL